MPRIRNEAACTTCQKRKLRCDERLPVCSNCLKAKRYCDHTRHSVRYRHASTTQRDEERPKNRLSPREALKDAITARLFAHYIQNLAAWYDLSDGTMHFTKKVPQEALARPLLFNAIIAFAAIHLSTTTMPSLRPKAERYHEHCIQLLLALTTEDISSDEGHHLAAVCTLRSYEILAEDFDPNRHLSGAYAFSAAASLTMDTPNLWKAGFFNYLREDITFSLMNRRALKIDLAGMQIPSSALDDEDQLNLAALYLAEAINVRFGRTGPAARCELVRARSHAWKTSLPRTFDPFYDSSDQDTSSGVFPTIRLPRDCHVAVVQYYHVINMLLDADTTDEVFNEETGAALDQDAIRICGLAFTSNSPTVVVNSFGPISYCAHYLRSEASQNDLVRRLHACERDTGWPVQRMIDRLQHFWTSTLPSHRSGTIALTAPG